MLGNCTRGVRFQLSEVCQDNEEEEQIPGLSAPLDLYGSFAGVVHTVTTATAATTTTTSSTGSSKLKSVPAPLDLFV